MAKHPFFQASSIIAHSPGLRSRDPCHWQVGGLQPAARICLRREAGPFRRGCSHTSRLRGVFFAVHAPQKDRFASLCACGRKLWEVTVAFPRFSLLPFHFVTACVQLSAARWQAPAPLATAPGRLSGVTAPRRAVHGIPRCSEDLQALCREIGFPTHYGDGAVIRSRVTPAMTDGCLALNAAPQRKPAPPDHGQAHRVRVQHLGAGSAPGPTYRESRSPAGALPGGPGGGRRCRCRPRRYRSHSAPPPGRRPAPPPWCPSRRGPGVISPARGKALKPGHHRDLPGLQRRRAAARAGGGRAPPWPVGRCPPASRKGAGGSAQGLQQDGHQGGGPLLSGGQQGVQLPGRRMGRSARHLQQLIGGVSRGRRPPRTRFPRR